MRRARVLLAALAGSCTDSAGPGGALLQNVRVGNVASAGLATNFINDCLDRGWSTSECNGQHQFFIGSYGFGTAQVMPVVWLVDVDALADQVWRFDTDTSLQQVDHFVVVGGSRAGNSYGWPGPLGPGPTNGSYPTCLDTGSSCGDYHPGTPTARVYAYSSIEAALADTSCADCPHPLPPMIGTVTVGWSGSDAPDCVDAVDNDMDGTTDYPADSSCASLLSESEGSGSAPSGKAIVISNVQEPR